MYPREGRGGERRERKGGNSGCVMVGRGADGSSYYCKNGPRKHNMW